MRLTFNMRKNYHTGFFIVALMLFAGFQSLFAQKKISDLTLVYETSITAGENKQPGLADALNGAVTTVYIKGHLSRSEMNSALFSSTTIHDARTGNAVVLREVSGQKLMIRMTAENMAEKNSKYEGVKFENTGKTKSIAGYNCQEAIATLKDGSSFKVYYTTEIIPENKSYDYQFKDLNGLPLEYELSQGNLVIRYTVSMINLNPVPASKFDIPKSGYRVMTYEESQQLRR